ncbi:MerR family transcriptional regulator [Fretibacterium sp. OH1220_COT-178]|uniref:MerR family transcriptional regulator n=1 Tax=Fretibacterium sp. OH1220_COT-178 TaxID=2491047 RepID=UPI000F5F9BC7|nr:MerR family transcriptional regulator [Fretibacterium sp. OH1220_COT-178]RRD64508.1 MerR family transcriptional regulator [Fretibacterium sp. OH1220_COT-178]
MDYSIGEFSKLTGLGIHTLRYYEREHLLAPERNAGNRRRYSDRDMTWVDFIKRLKDTGMPIREIKRYALLRAAGESTLNERLKLLLRHRRALKEQVAKLQEHQSKLDDKIQFYREEIERRTD